MGFPLCAPGREVIRHGRHLTLPACRPQALESHMIDDLPFGRTVCSIMCCCPHPRVGWPPQSVTETKESVYIGPYNMCGPVHKLSSGGTK